MPEGHAIHRIARDHHDLFAGQSLQTCSPQGRFAESAAYLQGRRCMRVEAHGKHLFYHWEAGAILHIHLGLYGKFRLHHNPPPAPVGQVRLRCQGIERSFDLNGPNCCELIGEAERSQFAERLGADPLRNDADPGRAWSRIQNSRAAIGSLLLDQSVLAGIGNIYRSELLFAVGIAPARPGNTLQQADFQGLWSLAVKWLRRGVRYNRIITVDRSQVAKPLSRLAARDRVRVYKQPDCPSCGLPITVEALANRKVFFCPRCQT